MADLNVEQFFKYIPSAFQADKAAGVDARVQFDLKDGDQTRNWTMTIKDMKCDVVEGAATDPTVTLSAKTEDCIQMFTGKLDPTKAFMQGRIKLKGNLGQAMKLLNIFKLQ